MKTYLIPQTCQFAMTMAGQILGTSTQDNLPIEGPANDGTNFD